MHLTTNLNLTLDYCHKNTILIQKLQIINKKQKSTNLAPKIPLAIFSNKKKLTNKSWNNSYQITRNRIKESMKGRETETSLTQAKRGKVSNVE